MVSCTSPMGNELCSQIGAIVMLIVGAGVGAAVGAACFNELSIGMMGGAFHPVANNGRLNTFTHANSLTYHNCIFPVSALYQ